MSASMRLVQIPITLVVQGRFLTASSSPSAPGVDTAVATTPDGKLLLPFSLVKGKLREVIAQISADCELLPSGWLDAWLGPKEAHASNPDRGRIRISDFQSDTTLPSRMPIDVRIEYDSQRKSVRRGALQVFEVPVAAGDTAQLSGTIRFLAEDQSHASTGQRILAALSLIDQFGSNRTVGFGRLKSISVKQVEVKPMVDNVAPAPEVEPAHLIMRLTPEAAFCVSKHKLSDNIFKSAIDLSGSVIKGVLASMLREVSGLAAGGPATPNEIKLQPWSTLAKYLDKIRFTPARPTAYSGDEEKLKFSAVPPKSLVTAAELKERHGGTFRDVAFHSKPCMLGDGKSFHVPAFSVDWKGDTASQVDQAFGVCSPQRELRVRTAISEQLRRAQDEQLFAYDMVHPSGLTWLNHVFLDDVPEQDRDEVRRVLAMLTQHGVWGIGKTKAYASAKFMAANVNTTPIAQTSLDPINSNQFVICLQSPAIIHDPRRAHFMDLKAGESRAAVLREAYASYWSTVSDGSLELSHMFAEQSLAGGEYISHRFQTSDDYEPYVLTNSGSVFVLKTTDSNVIKAQSLLKKWLRTGLPLSPHLGKDLTFMDCPYRPQEGFGEIAVNMQVHSLYRPDNQEIQEIC